MDVELLFPTTKELGDALLGVIERAARVSHRSKMAANPDQRDEFLRKLLRAGHWSVVEHAQATVLISGVTRGFTHEFVRHRLGAITQESTRYKIDDEVRVHVPGAQELEPELSRLATELQHRYRHLPRDVRRHLLPIGVDTRLIATHNLRSWHHLLEVRLDKHAHPEIREVAAAILKELGWLFPPVFDDLLGKETYPPA